MTTAWNVAARLPLVLVVDPEVASRHLVWRALNRAFGVVEAPTARAARDWMAQRPDIDALVVRESLPDEGGGALVAALASEHHPAASRAIVLARPAADVGAVVAKLAQWFFAREAGVAGAPRRPQA